MGSPFRHVSAKQHYFGSVLLECLRTADLHYASELLRLGADPAVILEDGASPFHLAVGLEDQSVSKLFTELFLSYGADPNVRSREGCTPLHTAAAYGRADNLLLLLKYGGDPDLLDQDDMTVEDNARASQSEMCKIYLIMYRQGQLKSVSVNPAVQHIQFHPTQNNKTSKSPHVNSTENSCSPSTKDKLPAYLPNNFKSDISMPKSSPSPRRVLKESNTQTSQSQDLVSEINLRQSRLVKSPLLEYLHSKFPHVKKQETISNHGDRSPARQSLEPESPLFDLVKSLHAKSMENPIPSTGQSDAISSDSVTPSTGQSDTISPDSVTPNTGQSDAMSPDSVTPSTGQYSFRRLSEYSFSSEDEFEDTNVFLEEGGLAGYNPHLHQIDVTSPDHPVLVPRLSDDTLPHTDHEEVSGSSGTSFHTCPSPVNVSQAGLNIASADCDRSFLTNATELERGCIDKLDELNNSDSHYYLLYTIAEVTERDSSDATKLLTPSMQHSALEEPKYSKQTDNNSPANEFSAPKQNSVFRDLIPHCCPHPEHVRNTNCQNLTASCVDVGSFCPSTPRQLHNSQLARDSTRDTFEFDQQELDNITGISQLQSNSSSDTIGANLAHNLSQLSIFTDDNSTFLSETPKILTPQRYATRTAASSHCSEFVASWGDVFSYPQTSTRAPSVASSLSSRVSKQSRSSQASSTCSCSTIRTERYLYVDKTDNFSLMETRLIPQGNEAVVADLSCSMHSQNSTVLHDWKESVAGSVIDDDDDDDDIVVAPEVAAMSNEQIHAKLSSLGDMPGPVTDGTRLVYLKRLIKVQQNPDLAGNNGTSAYSVGFLPEIRQTLSGKLDLSTSIIDDLEIQMSAPFVNPDPSKNWREGAKKSSFTYLLLDPRVTQNLPIRAKSMDFISGFESFLRAIFYIGKGIRARPYAHFKEAIKCSSKANAKKAGRKVVLIQEIWAAGLGVISLHIFQNVIPSEAYTREACMIEAMGLSRLTNKVPGQHYGPAATWSIIKRRTLGVLLLKKAFKIFLSEGERQIQPHDINM